MHELVLKMEVIDLDLQGNFGCFDSELLEFGLARTVTFYGFELESLNLHQICILGFSQLVLNMGGIDLDLQGHLAISTHKTAFNVALEHWSKPAKGCYTSQTCSCWHGYHGKIEIDHICTICAVVVGVAIQHSTNEAGSTSAVLDSSTNHNSADHIVVNIHIHDLILMLV